MIKKNVTVKVTLDWSIEVDDLELLEDAWAEVYREGSRGLRRTNSDQFDAIAEALISKIDLNEYIDEIEIEVNDDEDE